ncbi:MAG: DUF192 domain-containing protein, partial [Actinobacteria bacterium]|nr:DUF192 domain-containing protein [Actinomycetota bacterium]
MLYMVITPPLGRRGPVKMGFRLVVGLGLLLVGCNGYGSEASPSPGPTFDSAAAIVRGDEGSVLIKVEVAQSAEQRSRGLMFRDSLPANSGM